MIENCRLCSSNELKFYYSQGYDGQFKYYKCNNCSLVNLDLSNGFGQKKYTEKYVDPFDESKKINIEQTETYKFITKNLVTRGKILDIGCGNGRLLWLASKEGWQPTGIELSEHYAAEIKEKLGIDVIVKDFLELDPNKKQFDIITLRHVLEHIPYPVQVLNKIKELLKPNGIVVMEFPNIEGLTFKIKRLLNKTGVYKKKYKKDYIPGHSNEYNRNAFNYLTKATGFELKIWETYSSRKYMHFFYKNIKIGNKARALIQKIS